MVEEIHPGNSFGERLIINPRSIHRNNLLAIFVVTANVNFQGVDSMKLFTDNDFKKFHFVSDRMTSTLK